MRSRSSAGFRGCDSPPRKSGCIRTGSTRTSARDRGATWKTPRADAGRTLHDIDIQDGLRYASAWNDGLVVLDVGNGIKGGSPANPQFVSQSKCDLNALYRGVVVRDGLAYVNDMYYGLWIVKIEPKPRVVP